MGAVGVGEAEFVSQQSEGSSSSAGHAVQPGGPQPVGQPGKHLLPYFLSAMADTQESIKKATHI